MSPDKNDEQLPRSPTCDVLQEVMVRAVLCVGDGHSYEEAAISAWLEAHSTSPLTGEPLSNTALLPNHALRQMIQAAGPR